MSSENREMSEEEAIRMYDSEVWKGWTDYQRAWFQLHEKRLCMPMDVFQMSAEKALGRSVWTHELADAPRLISELEGKCTPPSIEDIIKMIPEDKRIFIFLR